MAERRISFLVEVDLERGSKEAHERTISLIADSAARDFQRRLEDRGYAVRRVKYNILMHYVRHNRWTTLTEPKKVRRLKRVV